MYFLYPFFSFYAINLYVIIDYNPTRFLSSAGASWPEGLVGQGSLCEWPGTARQMCGAQKSTKLVWLYLTDERVQWLTTTFSKKLVETMGGRWDFWGGVGNSWGCLPTISRQLCVWAICFFVSCSIEPEVKTLCGTTFLNIQKRGVLWNFTLN